MTGANYPCDIDSFAKTLEQILGDVDRKVIDKSGDAVAKVVRKGAKDLRNSNLSGKHEWSDKYRKGFRAHVERGVMTTGEVGNKAKPGLVHLLEHGHATLTGRRTNAYKHMEPAAQKMEEDLVKRMEKAIGEALS